MYIRIKMGINMTYNRGGFLYREITDKRQIVLVN